MMSTDIMRTNLKKNQSQAHSNCIVCSPSNSRGLGLEFSVCEDGSVEARFDCDRTFEGYADRLHGGVVASLLDGGMTNCMFAHGLIGVTAELKVRYLHPVVTGKPATVRAWIGRSSAWLHVLQARVWQDDVLKARATGKFMVQRHPPETGGDTR